jgi:UDP-N-acetylglucosamine--N-acetylmuramyl-(pentapeptide) pyrophosphoryl-undecaprenol N-acetylglucosamine transferase
MSDARAVLLAAGGTGGHLFPAEALADALARRGLPVELATDDRALRYGGRFPARAIHTIAARTPTGGGLRKKALAVLTLARGTFAARALLRRTRPLCVVGFGGYPTVPPVLAATMLRIPTILHEQNAVMGRANRFMAGRVDRIATGFGRLEGAGETIQRKAEYTGNPVRPAVLAAARIAYPGFDDGALRLVVTGGSQGARVMTDVVPPAIELLPPDMRARLVITQQARAEDAERATAVYGRLGVKAEVSPFFADLPARIAGAHLAIARSGASTVSELAVIGRPSILVPFPFALDQDQASNAAHLAAAGAATVIRQSDFTPQWLAARLAADFADPQGLTQRAQAAKSASAPDAAERLANLVLRVARIDPRPE